MMYKEILIELTANNAWVKLQLPCNENELEKAEKYIGYSFPSELKDILRETDGDNWFLLSVKQMIENIENNRTILAGYMEEDEFEEKVNRNIYFATNGCGDYYCYRTLPNGETDTSAIYIWDHELFETREVAKDLIDLIKKYYNNEV